MLLRLRRLLLFCTLSLVLLVPLGPAQGQQTVELGTLRILPGDLSGRMQICKGEEYVIKLIVKNDPQGIDIPLPVDDAHITVVDNTGRREVSSTGRDGLMLMTWPTDREGVFTLTATAYKKDYVSGPPYTFNIQVRSCRWELGVNFVEEYYLVEETNLVVGAVIKWDGLLDAGEARGDEGDGGIKKIEMLESRGMYRFYARDEIEAPFHFSLEQPVEGEWKLNASGTLRDGMVRLSLGEEPVSYPPVVNLKITDYGDRVSDRHLDVNYAPPVATSGGNGMALSLNKIWTAEFPSTGGEIRLTSGMKIFLELQDVSDYLLVVYLKPFKTVAAAAAGELAGLAGREVQP